MTLYDSHASKALEIGKTYIALRAVVKVENEVTIVIWGSTSAILDAPDDLQLKGGSEATTL